MKYLYCCLAFAFAVALVECRFYPLDARVCEMGHDDTRRFAACFRNDLWPNQRQIFDNLFNCMRETYRVNDYSYFFHYSECGRDPQVREALIDCLRNTDARVDQMLYEIGRDQNHIYQVSRNCADSLQRD